MVEKIYDTLKAILYSEFPKNTQGYPEIYDRVITGWFFGDREILPAPLGVIFRGSAGSPKDIGYGLREIEYTIGVTFFADGDDKETSERVVQESARVAHSILKNHRSMWICDLCPFCGKFPLSPVHYIDNGIVTEVGITTATLPANQNSYSLSIQGTAAGYTAPSKIKLQPGISGKVTVSNILSCGMGITQTSYSDANAQLTLTLSDGSGHTGYSTNVMYDYLEIAVDRVNSYWAETHTSPTPPYYDWPGLAYQAVKMFISDWRDDIKPITIIGNTAWSANLDAVVNNNAELMRYLQDIQVGEIKPSDDGMNKAFLHSAEFTLRGKEIISVDQFGPNNVDVNAV